MSGEWKKMRWLFKWRSKKVRAQKLTSFVGELVGETEGLFDGDPVGLYEGERVGLEVGCSWMRKRREWRGWKIWYPFSKIAHKMCSTNLLTSFVGELVGYFVGSSVGSKLIDGSDDGWLEGTPLVDGAIETDGSYEGWAEGSLETLGWDDGDIVGEWLGLDVGC